MLTPQEICAELQDRNLSFVSEHSGVAYNVVNRFAKGMYERASYETVRKLSDYLEGGE